MTRSARLAAVVVAIAAALIGVPGQAAADSEPFPGSFLLSRSTVARQADSYTDATPGITFLATAAGVGSLYCGPAAPACLGGAGLSAAAFQGESALFNRAKRQGACVVFLYLPGLGSAASGAFATSTSTPYVLRTYNGPECRNSQERPITPELFAAVT